MNKSELINIHRLLNEIKDYMIQRDEYKEEDFKRYNDLKTRPEHVHKSKNKHKEAVFTLKEELENNGKYVDIDNMK